jgi:hypothetical protein
MDGGNHFARITPVATPNTALLKLDPERFTAGPRQCLTRGGTGRPESTSPPGAF